MKMDKKDVKMYSVVLYKGKKCFVYDDLGEGNYKLSYHAFIESTIHNNSFIANCKDFEPLTTIK